MYDGVLSQQNISILNILNTDRIFFKTLTKLQVSLILLMGQVHLFMNFLKTASEPHIYRFGKYHFDSFFMTFCHFFFEFIFYFYIFFAFISSHNSNIFLYIDKTFYNITHKFASSKTNRMYMHAF